MKCVLTRNDDTDVVVTFVVSFNGEVHCTTDSRCVNLFKEFKTARANAQNLFYNLKVTEFASLTTSESVSRMKCGHPGNFLVVCTGVAHWRSALEEVRKPSNVCGVA